MAIIEEKLAALGIVLPEPVKLPPGMVLPFSWVRSHGNRVFISGHVGLETNGSPAGPFGKVGAEVSAEDGYRAARLTCIAMLADLKREIGDLDRVTAWLRVFGMVNTAPDFNAYPLVINGCSDLIIELYGEDRGGHARSAVGMAGLPFDCPVEIEAEVAIDGG